MKSTDPDAEVLLRRLVVGQREALGRDLVGSYVFGSWVTGDFDPGVSDVDTVAVLRDDLTEMQFASLERLHRDIVEEAPQWEDRIDVVYMSTRAVETFRTYSSPAARISPGLWFHAMMVDRRWLIDWYQLREVGEAMYGPPAKTVVPPISHEGYVHAVREHLVDWPDSVDGLGQGSQAYAVLTLCRGLRTLRTGEYVSKREAARWGAEVMPEHAQLIRDALAWRDRSRTHPQGDGVDTREATSRFIADVKHMVDRGEGQP